MEYIPARCVLPSTPIGNHAMTHTPDTPERPDLPPPPPVAGAPAARGASRIRRLAALAGIGAIAAGAAAAFAWIAGWVGPPRLTAQRFIDAMEAGGPAHPGFRRAHAKGVCVSGRFLGTAAGRALSSAGVFAGAPVPVVGRLSIGGGDPHGDDAGARVRSLALQLGGRGEAQWRMAMNSVPFLAVATPEAFYAQVRANQPDPATGKPDPGAVAAFLAGHPRARAFQQWAQAAPWPDSWASTQYNSVNAFLFVDADGRRRAVRWSMRPQAPVQALDAGARARADEDFLAADLERRLAEGPLRWDMVVTLAGPDDAVDDPSRPWPDGREQVVAGVLVLDASAPQATGACRDINFDPLVLPAGVEGSGDPILAARSAVYSQSFNRREREIALGRADAAIRPEASR